MKFVAPVFELKAYTCPLCGVYAQMDHTSRLYDLHSYSGNGSPGNPVRTSRCHHCHKAHLWHFDEMVYPRRGFSPPPNPEMPADVQSFYEEAASISGQSPRAAAALLRLGIQVLCKHLGGSGKSINDDIALLVKRGLPVIVQQSLDVVRVVGNNAVHPGVIEDVDDAQTVGKLFELINVIIEYMISLPQRVDSLYGSLPEESKQAIKRRDGK